MNCEVWSSVASAATTLWPAEWRVLAYAAPGLPKLQISSGREVISSSSCVVDVAASGVSTREGGVCCPLALRFFFFLGVERVEDVLATEMGESGRETEVMMSFATASCCCESAVCGSSEIVLRSAGRALTIFGDVTFDIFGCDFVV